MAGSRFGARSWPLKGSRHSREYTLPELKGLLEGCGYTLDRAEDIDIYPPVARTR
ncbi:MAG: hypothetical protein ABIQ47_15195 [Tepidiformaceae bacterium]